MRPVPVFEGEKEAWAACVKAAISIKERPLADVCDTAALARGLWMSGTASDLAYCMGRLVGALESAAVSKVDTDRNA